jgi:hypothetical protein
MMPYSTPKSELIREKIIDMYDGIDEYSNHQSMFVISQSYTVDMVFHNTDNAHSRALKIYWDNRNGSLEESYELFETVIGHELISVLIAAFSDTREQLPQPSEILMEGKPDVRTDPEATSDGGKQSKKKS